MRAGLFFCACFYVTVLKVGQYGLGAAAMPRRDLERTLEFVLSVEHAKTPEAVCASVLKVVAQFGMTRILAGIIPAPGATSRQQEANVLLHEWPKEWWSRYFSRGYLFADPTIKRVVSDIHPFLWSELEPQYRRDRAASSVMDEAREFHLHNGFTTPLMTLDGAIAGFSLAGERIEVAPEQRGMLQLLATYALGRTLLLTEDRQAQTLTTRQRDVIRWAAEGKSNWEIGMILHISEHTADKMMRVVRTKLGVATRAHAVAKAIRLGIID